MSFFSGPRGHYPVPGTAFENDPLPFPSRSVRLFDIESDPRENYDIVDDFPDIVDAMLAKLATYNSTAVPPMTCPGDEDHGTQYTSQESQGSGGAVNVKFYFKQWIK